MHYTPMDMNEVRSLLGGIDGDVPVTLTPGVQLPPPVRTVSDLLVQSAWPEGHQLVVERYPLRVGEGRATLTRRLGDCLASGGGLFGAPTASYRSQAARRAAHSSRVTFGVAPVASICSITGSTLAARRVRGARIIADLGLACSRLSARSS